MSNARYFACYRCGSLDNTSIDGSNRYVCGTCLYLPAPTPGAPLAASTVTICRCGRMVDGTCPNLWPGHPEHGTCRCACHANDTPDPQTPAPLAASTRRTPDYLEATRALDTSTASSIPTAPARPETPRHAGPTPHHAGGQPGGSGLLSHGAPAGRLADRRSGRAAGTVVEIQTPAAREAAQRADEAELDYSRYSLLNPSPALVAADQRLRAQRAQDEATSARMIAEACATHSAACRCHYCTQQAPECQRADSNCEGPIRLTPYGWLCGWHDATMQPDDETPADATEGTPAGDAARWLAHRGLRPIMGGGSDEDDLLGQERIDRSTGWRLRVLDRTASPNHRREGGTWAVQYLDGPRARASFSATTTWLYQCTRPLIAGGAPTPADDPAGPGATAETAYCVRCKRTWQRPRDQHTDYCAPCRDDLVANTRRANAYQAQRGGYGPF